MIQQPTQTLTERAADKLEAAFPASHTETTRVVWWDDGGYLRHIVQNAANDLGIDFRAADAFPLDLRIDAVAEERDTNRPQVWYIDDGKDGRDWFRDIRETGGEIVCSIEELTADLYEVNPWDIFDTERHDEATRDLAAEIITGEFASPGVPQYKALKQEIITGGGGQILDHLLRDGWPEISRDSETVEEVRDRLRAEHSIPIAGDAGPDAITDTVRRWAVAQSLIDSGVSPTRFGAEYTAAGYDPLGELLQIPGTRIQPVDYLGTGFWPDVIDELDDVWSSADCAVDGALDIALWEAWVDDFEAGDIEGCIERAQKRQTALSVYPEGTHWVRVWTQSEHLARLERAFSDWDGRTENVDPFEAYSDVEEGTWRIDNEVLQLQLTGTPETDLQAGHPASERLPEIRDDLLTSRYRDYLETLAEAVEATIQNGAPFIDKPAAYEWWSDHEDTFDELGTVAVFLIDALRFDLAQRLAEQLEEDFEVKREKRLAALPTETKFGMAALTPGRSSGFSIGMDADGDELTAKQAELPLDIKSQRREFFDGEGWTVPDDPEDWGPQKIAYYDKELDDVGEGEIGDIERHFDDYIEDLSEIIGTKLDDENWDRIYVVTDHGFVLLPEGTTMESISVEEPNTEVKYRRVAGDELADINAGVHVPATTPGLNYLEANLELLVDPRQHFSKQGYSSSRYYHGGLLPQECMLSFLEIQN